MVRLEIVLLIEEPQWNNIFLTYDMYMRPTHSFWYCSYVIHLQKSFKSGYIGNRQIQSVLSSSCAPSPALNVQPEHHCISRNGILNEERDVRCIKCFGTQD